MSDEKETRDCELRRGDLEFFGKISASFSHDVNNVISGIYEVAGLLEDLSLMAERGKPLDPERIKKNVCTITRQAERGVSMIKKFNTFAHSVDDPGKVFELVDYLETIVSVSERLATTQNVKIELSPTPALNLEVCPFTFQKALFLCFMSAFDTLEHGGTINVSSRHHDDSLFIELDISPLADIECFKKGIRMLPEVTGEMNAECAIVADPEKKHVEVTIKFNL